MTTPFTDLIDLHEAACRQDFAESTANFYSQSMRVYLTWQQTDGGTWYEETTIRRFMDDEKARGLKPNSLIARYSSFLNFFKWVKESGRYDGPNPMVAIRRPPKPKEKARRAKRANVLKVIDSIQFGTWWLDQRDRTILRLLLSCGLRIGELEALTLSDVDTYKWTLSVPPIKFSRRRVLPLGQDGSEEWGVNDVRYDLDAWLRLRPTNIDTDALFLGYAGPYSARGPLLVSGARAAIKNRYKRAGLKYDNPHSIRHCFAVTCINSGMRAEVLQIIMGHSSIITTLEIYAQVFNDRIIEEARANIATANTIVYSVKD